MDLTQVTRNIEDVIDHDSLHLMIERTGFGMHQQGILRVRDTAGNIYRLQVILEEEAE